MPKKVPKREKKDKKSFAERNTEFLKSISDGMITDTLKIMLECDAKAYDITYIESRVRQMLDEAFKPVTFKDDEINRLRKELFIKKLFEIAGPIPEKLSEPDDEAQERENRCYPVCLQVFGSVLNQQCPEWYLDEAIENDEEILAENRLRDYINVLFDGLMLSVNQSLQRAQKKLWGCEKEDISMKRIDNILKI